MLDGVLERDQNYICVVDLPSLLRNLVSPPPPPHPVKTKTKHGGGRDVKGKKNTGFYVGSVSNGMNRSETELNEMGWRDGLGMCQCAGELKAWGRG